MKRAKSVNDLLNANFKVLPFEGEFQASFGNPELTGSWIIWGESGNGKTSFSLQLAKYFTQFGRVAYNSLEEGFCQSMQDAFKRVGMAQVSKKLILLDREPIEDLKERLRKHKSPDIIFIDSLQYADLTYKAHKSLISEFSNKLFIYISHAEGKKPDGRVGKKVQYDSFVKVRVEGYKAFPVSRYGGEEPFVIYRKGAKDYWSEIN